MKAALSIFACLTLPLVAVSEPNKDTLAEQFAELMVGKLAAMKSSVYQHRTDIDESTGKFNCDCSGLIGHVLSQQFPEHLLVVDGDLAPWRSRPLAATFYQTFEHAADHPDGMWRQVPRLMDARPGDIIAWRKPVSKLKKGSSTGHVCVVAGKPELDAEGRIRVRVIDSTNRPHANDTRKEKQSGLGAGDMWFQIDQHGRPNSYWRRADGKPTRSNPILIGRLQRGTKISTKLSKKDQSLIGLTEKAAAAKCRERGLVWRVIRRDETIKPIPFKRPNKKRVNAVIQQGKVLRIYRG